MSVSPLSLKDEGNALLHVSPSGAIEKWALAISSQECSEEIKIACYSNSALAYIQLRAWKDAIRCSSAAISLSPTAHIKSLFRRAQAYRMLGSFGRSAADLRSILKADKSNSAARVELDAVTAARLRPNVHADFMVRLLHCDKTDDFGNEDGLEAGLFSCFELSAKGLYQEAFQLFKGLPIDADNETGLLNVSRRACEAWLLLNNMQFDEAEDVALRLVEDLADSSSKTAKSAGGAVFRADSLMLLAWILSSAGHFDSALDRCDDAVQLLREHYGRDTVFEVARALVNVGSIMVMAGHSQDAFAIFKKALSTFTRETNPVHFEMVITMRLIGDACIREKEYSNGLGSYQEAFDALKKSKSLSADDIPHEVARLHLGVSMCALGLSKYDDALAACQQAASLCSATQDGQLRGNISFDILWQRAKILNEQYQTLFSPDAIERTIDAHDRALAALKVSYCNNEIAAAEKAAYVFQSRALCLYRSGQHELALVDHLEASRLHGIACKGLQTPLGLVFSSNVAQCLLAVGRNDEALAHWTQTESSLAALFPNEKDRCAPLISCTINRAVVLLAIGRKEDAKSAVASAKALGSTFGLAAAVFAVQCVMTSASFSPYLSACALLYLLPELDYNSGNSVSNSVVRSFAASLAKLVKDVSNDPNEIYRLSVAAIPSCWLREFAENLSDLSRISFDAAVQHLQVQLN